MRGLLRLAYQTMWEHPLFFFLFGTKRTHSCEWIYGIAPWVSHSTIDLGPPTQVSINYLGLGNLCTHFVNLKTFCVCAPPSSTLRPGLGRGCAYVHTQFVRIPQVCLHFRWFLVIAQCNLCDRRGKVNVDVPTIGTDRQTDRRDGDEEGEVEGQEKLTSPSANRLWRQRHEKPFICANVSQGSNYNLLLVIM